MLFGKIEVRAAASAYWLCTYFWNPREQIAETFSGEKESNTLLSSAGAARSAHILACRSLDQVAHPTPVCVPFDSRAASVTLLWDPNPEPDNALYRLYVGILSIKAGNPPLMGFPTEKTIYTVEGLDYLRTYYFVVTAENNDHLESGYSNEVIVQLALPTPTPTPTRKKRKHWK